MARINYEADTKLADTIFPKLTKRLPYKAMKKLAYNGIEHYLFEKKSGCYCTACNRNVEVKKLDKQNAERKCPVCHKPVIVKRNGTKHLYNHKFVMFLDVVGDILVSRFFHFEQEIWNGSDKVDIDEDFYEVGRQFFVNGKSYRFEYKPFENCVTKDGWCRISDSEYAGYYFSISKDLYRRYYNPNWCCMSYLYLPQFNKAVEKVGLSYKYFLDFLFDRYEFHKNDKYSYGGYSYYTICDNKEDTYSYLLESVIVDKAELVAEKFYKCGLGNLLVANSRREEWTKIIKKKPSISILDVLGINRAELRWLKSKEEQKYAYDIVKASHNYNWNNEEILNGIYEVKALNEAKYMGSNVLKKINYCKTQKITFSEYTHYLSLLNEVNAPMDKSNLYPKDFRFAEKRVIDELHIAKDMKIGNNKALIEKLTQAIRKMPNLKEMLGESSGLVVKVPETASELIQEGKRLHNCLGTYIDDVANGECLILFIRRIDEPDTAYYACEYKNGKITQLYTYNNSHDKNYEVVYSFCSSFLTALNEVCKSKGKGKKKNVPKALMVA